MHNTRLPRVHTLHTCHILERTASRQFLYTVILSDTCSCLDYAQAVWTRACTHSSWHCIVHTLRGRTRWKCACDVTQAWGDGLQIRPRRSFRVAKGKLQCCGNAMPEIEQPYDSRNVGKKILLDNQEFRGVNVYLPRSAVFWRKQLCGEGKVLVRDWRCVLILLRHTPPNRSAVC